MLVAFLQGFIMATWGAEDSLHTPTQTQQADRYDMITVITDTMAVLRLGFGTYGPRAPQLWTNVL